MHKKLNDLRIKHDLTYQQLSDMFNVPIDVEYGDNILLLVTCEYVYDNGRFVIALREVRSDESEDALCELLMQSKEN